MPLDRIRRARAFAPCHVTGVVVPAPASRDPRGRGSLGAGLVLDLGVEAEARWEPGDSVRLQVRGTDGRPLPISEEVARRLLESRRGRLSVQLNHALPIGQGFGTSAAGALATGLAVSALFRSSQDHAVDLAHLADLFGGGGLGGVAAILGGGLEVRQVAGIPPFGHVVRLRHPDPVLVGTYGPPIPSPMILGDRRVLARLSRAGEGLTSLLRSPSPERYWDAAERFTDTTGLLSPGLRNLVLGIRRRGGRAAQAMFGSAFAATAPSVTVRREILRWVRSRGAKAAETRVARRGARRLPVPRAGESPTAATQAF